MNKDEMKNRISLALKDPILQQGFEIICKENAQWKQRNEILKDALKHARKVYGDDLEKSYKEIAELKADNDARKFAMAMSEKVEKQLREENAKLKFDLNKKENTVHTLDVLHKEAVRKYGEVNDQLTNAKEIIEGLMRFCRCFAQHHTEDIRYKEAEQFLRECE